MKTLIMMRHAKSSWEYDVGDRERPLKKRGMTDAKVIAKKFNELDIEPDRIYSSPANRALSTCHIFLDNTEISYKKLEIIEDLYDFGGQSVVNFIKKIPDEYQTTMIFGHNHAFTAVVNTYGSRYIDNLPTAGLAMINFEITSWKDLKKGDTQLLLLPRDYR